jgi:hypothetical protein
MHEGQTPRPLQENAIGAAGAGEAMGEDAAFEVTTKATVISATST